MTYQEATMRKALFMFGWVVLFVLPVLYGIEIYMSQDLPRVDWWKWLIPAFAAWMIYLARDREDVLKHKLI